MSLTEGFILGTSIVVLGSAGLLHSLCGYVSRTHSGRKNRLRQQSTSNTSSSMYGYLA